MIGRNIKFYRKKHKLTQTELAQKIGIDRSVLSRYENEEVDITVGNVVRIARFLGITPLTLMRGVK